MTKENRRSAQRHFERGSIVRWGIAVLVLAALPLSWRWLSDDGDNVAPALPSGGPMLSAQGAQRIVAREGGRKVWEFAAEKIEISQVGDKTFATATKVSRGIWYRDGKPYLQLQAQRVRFDQTTRDWQTEGDFLIRGPDKFSLRAKRATWNENARTLDCPGEVQATFRGAQLRTSQVVYEASHNRLRSQKNVDVQAKGVTLRGAPVVADVKQRTIEWQGGVSITIRREAVEKAIGRPIGGAP